jgi:hypothetical protein
MDQAAEEKFADALIEFVRVARLEHPELTDEDDGRFVGGILMGMLLGIWRKQSCGTDEDLLRLLDQKMREYPRVKVVDPEAP